MTWVLTNKKLKMDLPLAYTRQGTQLFSDQLLVKKENIQILLEGYIIPRDPIYSEYQNYRSDDLIVKLYKKYGSEFTRYIKGVFLIIIIDIDQINIFSDRFGIKKFFYSNNSDTFILSNKLDHITHNAGS